ncbi:ABC-2 type transport system ATP-binding protein [Caloranaerobacter azorensis DSM 13643]|uniref:ABC-2 type transport system ATP-binding protein n=1 Tax=Caloranaerobacter azorensis DSM 13643 TaxID=1121264 RepID=A0A1M5U5B0_9FIRM|nr:ABC transporter ATP-binding protein [Caloranaerobacter azorensis]SHH58080.1 ABC-2 type transport system ATP-binding protein [Caloranaerobacter azorensis DSM 13643]
MIRVKNLDKYFGNFKALDNVNLNVPKGSIYGLVGPNGAGKTTLIKHLTGIYKQNNGDVEILGEKVYENINIKSKIGYIPDDLYFFPQYTIKNMASYYKRIYSDWNEERYQKLKKVFEIDENKKVNKLSKGMQKQVLFWLTLSIMPKVMILDEPIDGLDPLMRKKVWNLIVEDVAERETTVLISSHNLKELENICDHVGIMHKGKMLIESNLDELKSDVHKIQIAYKNDFPTNLDKELKILYKEKRGSIYLLIVKGNREKIVSTFNKYNPIILDILPLSLEEVFIYELGGAGYEITNIIF